MIGIETNCGKPATGIREDLWACLQIKELQYGKVKMLVWVNTQQDRCNGKYRVIDSKKMSKLL